MISIGLGLVAAFCWGTADFLAKQWGERYGILNVVLFQHLFSVLFLISFIFFLPTNTPYINEAAISALMIGVLSAAAYTLLYSSLVFGDLSINSPIASSSAGLSILLALSILEERPGPVAGAGMFIIITGVVLINFRPDEVGVVAWRPSPSIYLALGAAVLLGTLNFLVPVVLRPLGAFSAVLLVRLSGTFLLASAAAIIRRPLPPMQIGVWSIMILLATLDATALLAYFASATTSYVSIGAALSGTFAAVSAVLGWLVLRERASRVQHVSVAMIVVGIFAVLLP